MTTAILAAAIAAINEADDVDLAHLRTAIDKRASALRAAEVAALSDGDQVRLAGNLSPRYLLGMVGTYRGAGRGARVRVEFSENELRFADPRMPKYLREGKYVDVPHNCVAPAH